MSLGIDNDTEAEAQAQAAWHRSAGLAFVLSLVLPGAGQFYCRKNARGWVTLGFWLLGIALCFSPNLSVKGAGLLLVFVLWVFAFLDAYFTAAEINCGTDLQVDVQNPRVAVTLNLLTAGFGYFYLGERVKGTAIFVATQIVRFAVPRITGFAGGVVSLALMVVQMLMAADAYRIARAQLKEALGPEPPPTHVPASRLPAFVPIGLACFTSAAFLALMIYGLAADASRGGARPLLLSGPTSSSKLNRSQNRSGALQSQSVPPIPPTDLPSAVSDVQRLERKTDRTNADVPELEHDVRIFASVLRARKLNSDDSVVAHFYEAEALRLINATHEQEGDPIQPAAATEALADYDLVIAANPNTYVPAVRALNAEYYAGFVARNQLRFVTQAYKNYWEKCAWQGHAGCLNILANARLTGDGEQKIDINEALDLHTMVFNTGVRYRCAAAHSAINIAEIVHFTGVRRTGDDELDWLKKSYALMDQLEKTEGNQNVCGRSHAEVEEFLFELSRGKMMPNLLQDAAGRLDSQSSSEKSVIQFLSGSIRQPELNLAVEGTKSERDRCTAFFDAMWYTHLTKQDALAKDYHQRLLELGKFHCGDRLVYASQLKL